MSRDPRDYLIVAGLTQERRAAIAALAELCLQREGNALPLSLEAPEDRLVALSYAASEQLRGVATIVNWGSGPEVSIIVHPDHRRQGVGRALLAAALRATGAQGFEALTLIAQRTIATGALFALAMGAALRFSEHRLVLDAARVDLSRPRNAALRLRPASADDRAVLARIVAAAFGAAEAEASERVAEGLQMPDRQYFLGELHGEPIGLLRVGRYGAAVADITSFGVLPNQQGRGYGRQMLANAVELLLDERWPEIAIEVQTDNANALGLYQSCGFVVQSTYDYYAKSVAIGERRSRL